MRFVCSAQDLIWTGRALRMQSMALLHCWKVYGLPDCPFKPSIFQIHPSNYTSMGLASKHANRQSGFIMVCQTQADTK